MIKFLLIGIWLIFSSHFAFAEERLVTIGGAVTEIVFALGKQSEIVATDITSYYPEATQSIPKIGYMRTLSAEGLLSTKPTLVIAEAGAGPRNVLDQIKKAGVTVIQLDENYSALQVAKNIRLIGRVLKASSAESLAKEYEDAWQLTQKKLAKMEAKPRILFVLDNTGKNPQAAGDDTAANAIINLMQGRNVMAGKYKGYRPLTAESVIAASPDFIITTKEGVEASGGLESFLEKSGLGLTPAGQSKRVIYQDTLKLLGFTPRLPRMIDELSSATHPLSQQ
ncbi:MAG TPA: ABC transporter substrate-binding protein [Methylophilaceae bacterium]|jgi:iron complex transport system substrate-binding protein